MLDMLEIEEKPLPNPLLKEREKSFPLGEDLGEAVGVRGGLFQLSIFNFFTAFETTYPRKGFSMVCRVMLSSISGSSTW